jgi:hypothetical protein
MLWTLFGIVLVLWLLGCSFQLIWEIPAIAMQGSGVRSYLAPPIRLYCRRSNLPAARNALVVLIFNRVTGPRRSV